MSILMLLEEHIFLYWELLPHSNMFYIYLLKDTMCVSVITLVSFLDDFPFGRAVTLFHWLFIHNID